MPSTTACEILDDITASCLAGHPDVFPIPGALARTVDEVQEIAANADALRAYARQARNRQFELDAAEIRIRANRRVGELMSGQGRTVGMAKSPPPAGRNGWVVEKPDHMPPTLAEAGIDKNLAHRARTLAAVPAEKFEELLREKRRRQDRSVNLDPTATVEADAASDDIEMPCDVRGPRAPRGWQPGIGHSPGRRGILKRRVNALEEAVKVWKARAEQAGWKEAADASPGGE